MDNLLRQRQKQFRATGLVLFEAAMGLLVARIIANVISPFMDDRTLDLVFTILMQVVFLLIVPFFTYKLILKKSVKETFTFSNVRKPNWKIMLLCIPLGMCAILTTVGVSLIWQSLLILFGYNHSSSATVFPENFMIGMLLMDLFLTGVLPGLCEEFTNRGGFLTTMRGSFSQTQTIILCGLAFGLFHQNVTQVFYTSLFGMLMATLTIKTKSIWPAALVHFMNNGLSVYSDYAMHYNLPFGDIMNWADKLVVDHFALASAIYMVGVACGVFIFWLILSIAKKDNDKQRELLKSKEGEDAVLPLEDKVLYKPVASDWAFYIGALVVTCITTLCTFYWGIL